jgi:homocysteine S-methyltransferase
MLEDDHPHLFDGGMGTELYARGVFINRSFDELNLTQADLVRSVHAEYVQSGAEIIETNTFGAARPKLEGFGLGDQVVEINRRGAEIAREAAGDRALVAGAIGPLGIRMEPFGPTAREEARAHFAEQAGALAEGGADLLVLETFGSVEELLEAVAGAREACDLPIVAQMTVGQDLRSAFGTDPEHWVPHLEEAGVDVLGVNCSVGPAGMLAAIERIRPLTDLPLSAMPNAGLPREVHGRKMYMASPEYMAKYAARLIRKGARFVGGCCGTTPEHTARMRDAVRSLHPARATHHAHPPAEDTPVHDPLPLETRSGLGASLAAGRIVTSVELLPPRGTMADELLERVRVLRDAGVDAVNVPDGPRAQMRMGVVAASALLEQVGGIEAVVHYTCRDRNLLGMLSELLGAHALGLRNLLLITGDPPKMGPYPDATAVFDIDSIGLTNLVSRLNHGIDPGGNSIGDPTSFVFGVGVNPGAVDLEEELHRFYWKVDAGAEYAITQPIFDAGQLMGFLEEVDRRDLHIPIIAGIWPLVSARNAEFLANEVPGVTIPEAILERMRAASQKGRDHAVAEGVAIAREIWDEVGPSLQGIQVSAPFGRVEVALQVLDGVLE